MATLVTRSKNGQADHYSTNKDLVEHFDDTEFFQISEEMLENTTLALAPLTVDADGWNNFKNATVVGNDIFGSLGWTATETVNLNNFVHVDADYSNFVNDVHLTVSNSKRGNIEMGAGDDILNVSTVSNETNWSNTFKVDMGNGSDAVNLTGGEELTRADDGYKFRNITTDGSTSTFEIDLGNDTDEDIITTEILANLVLKNFGGEDKVKIDIDSGNGTVSIDGDVATIYDGGTELFEVSVVDGSTLSSDDFMFI